MALVLPLVLIIHGHEVTLASYGLLPFPQLSGPLTGLLTLPGSFGCGGTPIHAGASLALPASTHGQPLSSCMGRLSLPLRHQSGWLCAEAGRANRAPAWMDIPLQL